ncbi:MAG: hypothetical protein ABIH99_06000 [Candidatus Micrarchaeota archaeon]
MKTRKAQISLEFLVVFVALLSFLALWGVAITNVREGVERSSSIKYAELALSDVKNAVDDVCVTGAGNKRTLAITAKSEFDISVENGNMLVANVKGEKITKEVNCKVVLLPENKTIVGVGELIVERMGGSNEVEIK